MSEENNPIDSAKTEPTLNIQQPTPIAPKAPVAQAVEAPKAPVAQTVETPKTPVAQTVETPKAPVAPRPAVTPRPAGTVAPRPAGTVGARPKVGVAPKANYAAKRPTSSAPAQTVVKNDENPSMISVAIDALAAAVAVAMAVMILLDL